MKEKRSHILKLISSAKACMVGLTNSETNNHIGCSEIKTFLTKRESWWVGWHLPWQRLMFILTEPVCLVSFCIYNNIPLGCHSNPLFFHTPQGTIPQQGTEPALAGVTQWIDCWHANQRVTGSIPSLGHMPGLQARSPVGGAWEATTHWCFSPSLFSLPSPF